MRTHILPSKKACVFACAFLAFVGCAHVSQAQTTASPDIVAPGEPVVQQVRSYLGTVTRISATGQPATGTFGAYVLSDGTFGLITTINGSEITYMGHTGVAKTTGTAFIQADRQFTMVNGNPVFGPKPAKIPLYLTATTIHGGDLDKDGNGLLFRGELGNFSVAQPFVSPGN